MLLDFSSTPVLIDPAASPTTLVFRVRRRGDQAFSGEVRSEFGPVEATFQANGIDGMTVEYRLGGIHERTWLRVWSAAPSQNGWSQIGLYVNVWPDRIRIGNQAEPTEHDKFMIRMTDYDPTSMTSTPGELGSEAPSTAATLWERLGR